MSNGTSRQIGLICAFYTLRNAKVLSAIWDSQFAKKIAGRETANSQKKLRVVKLRIRKKNCENCESQNCEFAVR
ncbi:hypothetical protein BADSM9389_04180 [Buttiauxella agrestis]|nr:hypothetical protein BADSM9389_04180 [Buttiauxella agrestis]